jgi:hypothetical protein
LGLLPQYRRHGAFSGESTNIYASSLIFCLDGAGGEAVIRIFALVPDDVRYTAARLPGCGVLSKKLPKRILAEPWFLNDSRIAMTNRFNHAHHKNHTESQFRQKAF